MLKSTPVNSEMNKKDMRLIDFYQGFRAHTEQNKVITLSPGFSSLLDSFETHLLS